MGHKGVCAEALGGFGGLGVAMGQPGVTAGHPRGAWGWPWAQVPALRVPEGDTIYDFTWFPLMDSSQPPTCL